MDPKGLLTDYLNTVLADGPERVIMKINHSPLYSLPNNTTQQVEPF